jgi:hypothetical protein
MITWFGRPGTWLIIIGVPLLLFCSGFVLLLTLARALGPIDPVTALNNGGHVLVVRAVCGDDHKPMKVDTYEVLTRSGRPPKLTEGDAAGDLVQVVVGPDWVGQINVVKDNWWTDDQEQTDWIGEDFGWHERTVAFDEC